MGVVSGDTGTDLYAFFLRCFCSAQGLIQDDTCTERFIPFKGALSSELGFALLANIIIIL